MKTVLFSIFTLTHICASGQTSPADSMMLANDSLDAKLLSIISEFEEKGGDYLILREFSLFPITSRGNIMFNEDTCTSKFALDVHTDYSLMYIHIGRIGLANAKCYDELKEIKHDLSYNVNYFSSNDSIPLNFRDKRFTLYGKLDSKYIHETFETDFVNKHHPGMLHHVVTSRFGIRSY